MVRPTRWSWPLVALAWAALAGCGSSSRPAADAGTPDAGPPDAGVDETDAGVTWCAGGELWALRDPWPRPTAPSYCDEVVACASSDAADTLEAEGWTCEVPGVACNGDGLVECRRPELRGEVTPETWDTLCELAARPEVTSVVCWVWL